MEKKQSFGLRKKDLAVIGALLLLAVSCWLAYRLSYRPPEKQNLAVIMVDGQEVMRLNLMEEKDRVQEELDEKMERWVYLTELAEKIAEQG